MAAAAANHDLFGDANFQFGHDNAGHFVVNINDGAVLSKVNGATLTYIPDEFKLHQNAGGVWAPDRDFNALVAAGWDVRTATVVVMMRAALPRIANIAYQAAEVSGGAPVQHVIDDNEAALLAHNAFTQALDAVVAQAYTILLANAHSFVTKRHHFVGEDAIWGRIEEVLFGNDELSAFGDAVDDVKVAIFHHAFHPVAMNFFDTIGTSGIGSGVFSSVGAAHENLYTKCHGLIIKRHPATPAGCMVAKLTEALLQEVRGRRGTEAIIAAVEGDAKTPMAPWRAALNVVKAGIDAAPQDWNQLSPNGNTMTNLAHVARLERPAATIAGLVDGLGLRRSTVLRSKALTNLTRRMAAQFQNGQEAGRAIVAASAGAGITAVSFASEIAVL